MKSKVALVTRKMFYLKSKVTLVNQGVHFVHAVTLHIHECRNTQYCAQNKNKWNSSSCFAHQNAEFS